MLNQILSRLIVDPCVRAGRVPAVGGPFGNWFRKRASIRIVRVGSDHRSIDNTGNMSRVYHARAIRIKPFRFVLQPPTSTKRVSSITLLFRQIKTIGLRTGLIYPA